MYQSLRSQPNFVHSLLANEKLGSLLTWRKMVSMIIKGSNCFTVISSNTKSSNVFLKIQFNELMYIFCIQLFIYFCIIH